MQINNTSTDDTKPLSLIKNESPKLSHSMKKSKTTQKTKTHGPLGRKVISAFSKIKAKKVIDFQQWQQAKNLMAEIEENSVSSKQLAKYEPAHAAYIYTQNIISDVMEFLINIPELEKLADAYEKACDDYQPSYPPMSPHTTSYFSSWGYFDLSTNSAKKETFATVLIDLFHHLGLNKDLILLIEKMQNSRMGIYQYLGREGSIVQLKEYVTNKTISAICSLDYAGKIGETWYVRVLEPPFTHPVFNHHVIFTTPYVLVKPINETTCDWNATQYWNEYFQLTLYRTGIEDTNLAYEHLMKYGLSRNYWNEYIFLAYSSHKSDMILLSGRPDKVESLPQSDLARTSNLEMMT